MASKKTPAYLGCSSVAVSIQFLICLFVIVASNLVSKLFMIDRLHYPHLGVIIGTLMDLVNKITYSSLLADWLLLGIVKAGLFTAPHVCLNF